MSGVALPEEMTEARPPKEPAERAPKRTKPVEEMTLAQALVAAQAEMPAVEKDATNPHFRSKFTSLDHLIAKTRPVLNRHGLSLSQWPAYIRVLGGEQPPCPALLTVITHVSGETMEATMPLIVGKNDMQGLGSALTYAKRYAWAAALGISTDEDDDGNLASRPEVRQEPAGASRTRTQPAAAEPPVPASADDLATYEADVRAANLDWPAALAALGENPTAATLAQHREQLAAYLAKVAASAGAA